MMLFDFINKQNSCKIDHLFPCNHAEAKKVAIMDGENCKHDCCLSCNEMCGARCNPSAHNKAIKPDAQDTYFEQALLKGSGFTGGKKRILDFYNQDIQSTERAKKIKKEYGLGEADWPLHGYGLHGYDSYSTKGFKIRYRDSGGEQQKCYSWNEVEKKIKHLIDNGKYAN